jgi:hypothetical protein
MTIATWALAVLDLGDGKPADAADRLESLVAAPSTAGGHPIVTVFATADLIEVAAQLGRERTAKSALAVLEEWARQSEVSSWPRALLARGRGILAGDDEAEAHFTEALALHANADRPFDTARTELLYGRWLRRRRRRAEGRGDVRTARRGPLGRPGPGRAPRDR